MVILSGIQRSGAVVSGTEGRRLDPCRGMAFQVRLVTFRLAVSSLVRLNMPITA